MTLATDLDGKYTVTSQAGNDAYRPKESDGFTIIKGGKTSRLDGAGCEWHSTFEWAGENLVKMTSVVDPKYANADFRLVSPDGHIATTPQTYVAMLSVKTEAGLPVLTGTIAIGNQTINIIMRRVKA